MDEQDSPQDTPQAAEKARQNMKLRLAILLLVLSIVSMWASSRVTRHKLLTTWKATLEVGVVMLGPGGVSLEKRALIESRLPELDALLAREFRKYRPDAAIDPVKFRFAGAVGVEERPPEPPEDGSYFARALHMFQLSRYLAAVNRKAELNTSLYDTRIYVMVEPTERREPRFVEGLGAKNGDVGFVTTQLDEGTVDLTLIAIGHEFLHTVGATDKYDEQGHTDDPAFLPEPDREPRYPQRWAEIMVGEITISPVEGKLPDRLSEAAVGPYTAREIRWVKEGETAPAIASGP